MENINTKNKIKNMLSDREFFNILFKISIPIVIQFFLVSSLNMIDTFMIGRVGEVEVAAVGAANRYYFLFSLTVSGISNGCSVFMAQYHGRGDTVGIRRVMGASYISTMTVATFFTLTALAFPQAIPDIFSNDAALINVSAQYLTVVVIGYIFNSITIASNGVMRCIGQTKMPMIISIFAISTNIILNYIFIFGKLGLPPMGVTGAALATVIARVSECSLMLICVFSAKTGLRGKLREFFDFNKIFISDLVKKCTPIVINECFYALGTWMYTVAYGIVGTSALASAQIAQSTFDMFLVFSFGLSSSSLVIIGNTVGSGHEAKAREYGWRLSVLSFFVGLVMGTLLVFSAPFIVSFFAVSQSTAVTTVNLMRIFGLFSAFNCCSVAMIVGIFRGAGDAVFALKAEIGAVWLVAIPLALTGAYIFHLPAEGVGLLIQTDIMTKFIVATHHFKKGNWIHRVAR